MKIGKLWKFLRKLSIFFCLLVAIVLLLPQRLIIPVQGATTFDWNQESYCFYPWGNSVTHKGIDIFAIKNTLVIAPTYGFILKVETTRNGGNTITLLGPKLWAHYFAHLDTVFIRKFSYVHVGDVLGTVGNSGNAASKLPHLHYSIKTYFPYIWNYDQYAPQGSKKIFYLYPSEYFAQD